MPELDKGEALRVIDDVVTGVVVTLDPGRGKEVEARGLRMVEGDLAGGQGMHPARLWLDMKPCVPPAGAGTSVIAVDALCVVPPSPST